jgi:hypothetical protein
LAGPQAEALGKTNDARAHYEREARYSTAYLGMQDLVTFLG